MNSLSDRDSSPLTLLLLPEPHAQDGLFLHEATRALHRAERLLQISQTLNATHDPDSLLASIIKIAAEVLDCEAASILLYNHTYEVLEFAAATGSDPVQLCQIPVPLEGSLAGTVFTENRPVIVNDVAADARHYEGVSKHVQFQTRSLLGVPMSIDGRVTGVLEGLNKRRGPFTDEDTRSLTIIAAQAALAIRNAQQVRALEKANTQLRQLDKLRSNFMAVASHELRTPLSIIMGYGMILQDESDPAQREHIAAVLQASTQMNKVIETMTHMNLLRHGNTQLRRSTVPVQAIIGKAFHSVSALALDQGHDLIDALPEAPLLLRGDEERLQLVLENILKNAIRFTPRGGTITVRARMQDIGILIEVEDTGIGLRNEAQDKVFDEFFQVEDHLTRIHGGLGLGLTIAREIVSLHNGRIRARSLGLGTGTTVEIWIPTMVHSSRKAVGR